MYSFCMVYTQYGVYHTLIIYIMVALYIRESVDSLLCCQQNMPMALTKMKWFKTPNYVMQISRQVSYVHKVIL